MRQIVPAVKQYCNSFGKMVDIDILASFVRRI
jgi:hypothetical protein